VIGNRCMHSQSGGVEAERGWTGAEQRGFCFLLSTLCYLPNHPGNPNPVSRQLPRLFAKRNLQPFANRRSNSPMETRDLAKAASPRPTWAKLMNQELAPSLGFSMNSAGKFSSLMNCWLSISMI